MEKMKLDKYSLDVLVLLEWNAVVQDATLPEFRM